MRLLPKRLSIHIQLATTNTNDVDLRNSSRKRKKIPKKQARYRAVDSGSEISSDEAITPNSPHSSTSSTANEVLLDFTNARSGNFVRTIHIISKESRRRSALVTSSQDLLNLGSYDSISDDDSLHNSLPDRKAKEQAIYIASSLKREFGTIFKGCQLYSPHDFETPTTNAPEVSMIDMTKMIADRLYTYAYLTTSSAKSLPVRNTFPNRALGRDSFSRPIIIDKAALVRKLELDLSRQGDASLAQKPGGREAFYAFRYTLDHFFKHRILPSQKTIMVERARQVIEKCKENEAKLSPSEQACMYSFQRLMSGIEWGKEMEPGLYGLDD